MDLLGSKRHWGEVQRIVLITRCSGGSAIDTPNSVNRHLIIAGADFGSLEDVFGHWLSEFAESLRNGGGTVLEVSLACDLLDAELALSELNWRSKGAASEGKRCREGCEGRHLDLATRTDRCT